MPLSTFFFYCGNLTLMTAYAVLARLSMRPGGVTGVTYPGRMLKWSTVAFFALAACLHADMAVHTILGRPFYIDSGNRIAWDFSIIVFVKMCAVLSGIVGINADSRKRRRMVLPR